jgi:DNA polymerase-3 subunit delta
LVICYKYKKLDKRTKFAKSILDHSVNFESKKIYDNQVAPWINDYLRNKQASADPKVSDMLAEYLGSDLSKISNELDKLLLNTKSGQSITIADVQEQIGISKEFNVFELQNALGERNFVKANLIIKYFIENPNNNPLIPILSNLFTFFNKVFITSVNLKEADPILAKKLGLSSAFFLKDYRKAAQNYNRTHLVNIFKALKEADKHSKGVGSRHASEASILKDLLIVCMSR